jgi:Zn-dependent protease with chaperone function
MTTRTRFAIRISSALMICILATGQMLAQSGPQLPDPGPAPLSREQQIQLGFQAAAEVYKQMPVLPDNSPETQYIRQIGQRLASTIPKEYSWPFEFHTIAQKEINAFALPGGPMFVNVGTINAAENEAQIAGVMAHEMAHVYMQHSAKQMQKGQTTQALAGILGAILGARGGALGSLAQAGVQIGAGTLMLKYSRADESQADAVGTMILYRAAYDPRALADFFRTLEEESGSNGGPQFLSDHPNPGNREQAILNEIRNWPPKQYRTNSAAFNQVRQHAKTLHLYTAQEIAEGAKSGRWAQLNRQNGAVFKAPPGVDVQPSATPSSQSSAPSGPVSSRDVMPSSRLVSENLGPLTISRPENWEVIAPQQQGQSITIAPRAGITNNGIGYGVVINGAKLQNGAGNIDQITSEIVRSMQSGGGDLQPIGNPQPITVGGIRGRSVMMESTSPFPTSNGQQQRERDWLVTLPQQDGSVMYFVFVSPKSEYERLKPTFDSMLRSIQF